MNKSLDQMHFQDRNLIYKNYRIDLNDHQTILHKFSNGYTHDSLLLLNGTPFSWQSYLPLIETLMSKLQKPYNVYVYDIRGMGSSDNVLPLYTTPTMTPNMSKDYLNFYIRDMNKIVDFIKTNENLDKVSLFGWSWGGLQVARYLQLYPEKIDKVILTSTLYNPVPAFVDFSNTLLTSLIQESRNATTIQNIQNIRLPQSVIESDLGRWFYPTEINEPYYISSKNILENAKLPFYKNTIDILATIDLSPDWNKIYKDKQVLMLIANQDVTPAYMKIMQTDMQKVGINVVTITNNGKHPFYITHPDITVNAFESIFIIIRFIMNHKNEPNIEVRQCVMYQK